MTTTIARQTVAAALVVASAACGGGGEGSVVTGASKEQELTLDPGDAFLFDVRATLDHGGPGTGEVSIDTVTDDGATGAFTVGLLSSTSGEENEAEVLDPSAQPETKLAITAFAGCGSDKCAEETQVTFQRDVDEETSVVVKWTARASFTFESGSDSQAGIFFDIHARNE